MSKRKEEIAQFSEFEWVFSQLSSGEAEVASIVRKAVPNFKELKMEGFVSIEAKQLQEMVIVFYEAYFNEKNRGIVKCPWPRIDDLESKKELCEAAMKYSQTPWLHCNAFTNFILNTILDIEIYPLKRELTDPESLSLLLNRNGYLGFLATMVFGIGPKWLQWFVSLFSWIFTVMLGILFFITFASGSFLISFVLFVWTAKRTYKTYSIRVFYDERMRLCKSYESIREEIGSGGFSPSKIKDRLTEFEKKGAYVYSIAYDLLSLMNRKVSFDC